MRDKQQFEESLTAAWCKAKALSLPLIGMDPVSGRIRGSSKGCLRTGLRAPSAKAGAVGGGRSPLDTRYAVVDTLVQLRYELSRDSTDGSPPVPEVKPLWDQVDQLVVDAKRLQGLLDAPAEEADEAVMLAMRSVLAIRAVKYKLLSTYGTVPWEEMEYLLVLYVEANTVYNTLAFFVASADRVREHLKFFLDKVEKIGRKGEPKDLKKAPKGERVDWVEETTKVTATQKPAHDHRLTDLLEDFTLLRDWHSLKEILESLEAAAAALELADEKWEACGWLAFRGGLFVAGEKMKNSWTSPNLSSRFALYFEQMAPEDILELLRNGIRDVQAHSVPGTNADALTMSELTTERERKKLKVEIQRVLLALEHMIREAEVSVVRKRAYERASSEQSHRVMASIRVSEDPEKVPIHDEVISILKEAQRRARGDDETLAVLITDLESDFSRSHRNTIQQFLFSKTVKGLSIIQDAKFNFEVLEARERVVLAVQQHCPEHIVRIRKLLSWKSAEGLAAFQSDLNEPSRWLCNEDSRSRARSALGSIPFGLYLTNGNLCLSAIKGGLRELAARWQCDRGLPPLEPHAPALFGRELRNYLNHGDLAARLCSPVVLEEAALMTLILQGKVDVTRGGSTPCLRDFQKSSDEQLDLARLKDEMFRGAREGDLAEVQRAAGLGVHISSRDCRGRTLLHAAAEAGQAHVVEWLLGTKAVDPRTLNWAGKIALHSAANAQVADLLLDGEFGRPRPDAFSFTPLASAASEGRADVLLSLLRCYDVNYISNGTIAPLDYAGLGGHEDAVRVLLQAGARYDLLTGGVDRKTGPQSPLYHAATSGSSATVGLFLQPPPPLLPQPSDTDCWVALDHAGFLGHVDVARALIDKLHGHRRGAAIDCDLGHEAALGIAKGGSVEVASALLDRWPKAVNLRISIDDGAMLHTAAMYGYVELVKLLLDRGAYLLQRDEKSWTALHCAAAGGSVEVIDELWKHKERSTATMEGLPAEEIPPLCVAAIYGQLEAAKRLVDLGADMNTGKLISAHETPLYFAAREGHAPVVEWLLGQGARLHGEEAADTPLHAAAENGRLAVVQVLLPALNRLKKSEAPKRLALLQHLSNQGDTALHHAATSGSLWVVKHLLTREVQLLEKHYKNRLKAGESPACRNFTVYRRCWQDCTPLGFCAMSEAPSALFRALLGHMEDERVMALGGEDAQTVQGMVQEVLDGIAKYERKLPWKRVFQELNASLARLRRWEALRYLLKSIGSERMIDQPITQPSKETQDSQDSVAPVFLIPGIEGMAVMLQSLCEYIEAPTLVLQLPYTDEKNRTIQDFAQSVYEHIKSHLAPKASFKLVGYSFGGMVSTEVVRLLEQDGHVGELVLLDGAPAGMQELTKVWIKEDGNTKELEMDVLVRLWFLANQSDFDNFRCPLETQDRLSKESSLEKRLRLIIPKKSKTPAYSEKGMEAAFRSFVNRIVAVNNYRPSSSAKKLRSTVILIRPTNQTFKHDQEDCGLTDLFAQETIPVHFVEGDHNTMLDNVETAAIINSVLVEGTAENKTFGDKVPADFRLSAKSQ